MNEKIQLLKKEQRNFLSHKRRILKNKIILDNNFFLKLVSCKWFTESKVIGSFFSIKSEFSTKLINEFIQTQNKILCLPVINDKKNGILVFNSYSIGDELRVGKFNISEPVNDLTYFPDIIFAPCLGFDLKGYRLGYGGGYYDKTIQYLYSIGHSFVVVGLAYDDQKVSKIYHDNHDQKLNYILTEKQLYKIL